MKSFTECPDEVRDRINALLDRYYADTLRDVGLKIDLLFVSTDSEDTPALTHGGYPAAAVVRSVSAKDRVKGCGDAEITIDEEQYNDMSGRERDALLDHELYHLQLVLGRNGLPKRDEHGRPKLKMRKHDYQVGHFHEIARRWGNDSGEVQQASRFLREYGQLYFGFDDETAHQVAAATLPTEDSTARDATLEKLRPEGVENVTITTPGAGGIRIDKDGIKPEPSTHQVEAAAKIARTGGYISRALVQRELRVGYNMACAIVERLAATNIIGPETAVGRFDTLPAREQAAPPATAVAA